MVLFNVVNLKLVYLYIELDLSFQVVLDPDPNFLKYHYRIWLIFRLKSPYENIRT
jgi:hypothetical protein